MGNYNDDLMEQVADQGDGFYAYLDTYAQAEKLFRDRLTSTLAVVATDAKAQVFASTRPWWRATARSATRTGPSPRRSSTTTPPTPARSAPATG